MIVFTATFPSFFIIPEIENDSQTVPEAEHDFTGGIPRFRQKSFLCTSGVRVGQGLCAFSDPSEACTPANPCSAPANPCYAPANPCSAPANPCSAPANPCSAPADRCPTPANPCSAPANRCSTPANRCSTPASRTCAGAGKSNRSGRHAVSTAQRTVVRLWHLYPTSQELP